MERELVILLGSAALIAFIHTLIGPDHYLPFVALSKARGWSRRRTVLMTAGCGLGHVASSIAIGTVGIVAGLGLRGLELFESKRGEIAGWLLIAFGLTYGIWGLVRAIRGRTHTHHHLHADGTMHRHHHGHESDHVHVHGTEKKTLTPWVLFIVFVLGPCEPLIPLLMYPAATLGTGAVILVATLFSVVTIATMIAVVLLSSFGLSFVSTDRLARYSHALAGGTILLCGLAIQVGL